MAFRLNKQWLFVQHGCQTGLTTGLTTGFENWLYHVMRFYSLICGIVCCTSATLKDSDIGSECQLLEPVCLHVTVARNLSASWYHGCADIELLGRLQEISVGLFFHPLPSLK